MPLDPFFRSLRRFQEIIEAAAGGRSGRGGHAVARELLSCSFCGEHQRQLGHLIAGPGHYICNRCVGRAHAALGMPGTTASSPAAIFWRASDADQDQGCSFCGKPRDRVEAMAAADGGRICNECLDLCQEIIADNRA